MKKLTLLTVVLVMCFTGNALAQQDSLWSRTYGGERSEWCYSIIQTADSGFALAGRTNSFGAGSHDFWLVRTDADGDSLWSQTFGGGRQDECHSIIQTEDGGFALGGWTMSFDFDRSDFWLVRTDTDGDSLWSRLFGRRGLYRNEICHSMIQTADDGFALAGMFVSLDVSHRDFWLVKTDADGDSLWSRFYGGLRNEECNSIIQTADGGFALAGYTTSFREGNIDFWLLKTDADGDSLWTRSFGGERHEKCHSIIQTEDGGFALAGRTNSFGAGWDDFWLIRTDADGDSLWSRTYGGERDDLCYSLIQTADDGFALAGKTQSFGAGGDDFWLVKTNSDGDSLWSLTFGGRTNDVCQSIIQTADGGFALAGM